MMKCEGGRDRSTTNPCDNKTRTRTLQETEIGGVYVSMYVNKCNRYVYTHTHTQTHTHTHTHTHKFLSIGPLPSEACRCVSVWRV